MKVGAVATGSVLATDAAWSVLAQGGNAVDAAVAAVFSSMLSEVMLTGIAGGGAMMVKMQGKPSVMLDFFVNTPPTPSDDHPIDFVEIHAEFGDTQQAFHIGKSSVAVPGVAAGLLSAHQRFGMAPLDTVLAPTIQGAHHGIVVSHHQANTFQVLSNILHHNPLLQPIFFQRGRLLAEGDTYHNPAFAVLLEQLVQQGADYLYRGEGATLLLQSLGSEGLLTADALANYQVIERSPLVMSCADDMMIYTNPPPSVGGTLLIFLLRLIQQLGIKHVSAAEFVRAMQVTSVARAEVLYDANTPELLHELLSDSVVQSYVRSYPTQSELGVIENHNSWGATTHVSVIDRDGNAVSVTTTNGEGCGVWVPELGIMPNNMLGEEDLHPNGFFHWAQERRLATMVAPTIITQHSQPVLVVGSGGSNRIRTTLAQVILHYLQHDMSLSEAIHCGRMHLEGAVLHAEPTIDVALESSSSITLNRFEAQNIFFGGVNAVSMSEAVADPRRGGCARIA